MPNNVRLKSQWKRCTRIIMNPLYTWVNSRKKTKQDCFACSMLPFICWHHKLNQTCLQLAFFPHSPPMAASKTSHSQKFSRRSRQHRCKKKQGMNEWCTRYSSNAPLWWQGWLWAHAMESVDRICSTVTGSNKQRFSFVMMPISSNLHSKFVTWLGFLFQQGTQLVRFVGSDNPETQTRSNTPWRSLEANRLKLFGSCGWASLLHFTVQCHGHWTWHFWIWWSEWPKMAKAKLEHRARKRLSREACTGTGHMSAITSAEGPKATNQALVFAKQKAPGQQPLWSR